MLETGKATCPQTASPGSNEAGSVGKDARREGARA
jgi:hypothetical protein